MTRAQWLEVAALLGGVAFAASCRERAQPREGERPLPTHITPASQVQFAYYDLAGRRHVTATLSAIPPECARVVQVLDASGRQRGADAVVIDATLPDDQDSFATAIIDASEVEPRALAALPPGEGVIVTLPEAAAKPLLAEHDRVIIYTTTRCSPCERALAFLDARGVLYERYDVDRDATGAAQLAGKAKYLGAVVDRVPVVELRGRLLIGFEPTRLTTLLGDST